MRLLRCASLLEEKRNLRARRTGGAVYLGIAVVAYGDGKELYRSAVFAWDSKPADVNLEITVFKLVELQTVREKVQVT